MSDESVLDVGWNDCKESMDMLRQEKKRILLEGLGFNFIGIQIVCWVCYVTYCR